ncbi:MAG TPA: CHAT domain-containing protein [Anaerolineales bacterium]|nr:CHAT domain-containing protein [Anaerolineales bacterium]
MPTKGWKSYRDFFLKIEPAGEGSYKVSARAPAGGEARATFVLPFDEKDLEIFLLKIGQPKRLGTRGLILQPAQPALDFGNKLFNAVFKGDVRDIFVSARNEAERKDYGLRLRLRLEGAPELADLPWEYLYDGPDFLALSTMTPLVRYIDLPSPPRPLAVDLPLRILVTVSSPHGLPELDIDAEKSKIQNALVSLIKSSRLELEFSQDATLQTLQRTLRRARSQGRPYHAWHFIGHGIFDPSIQAGQLALCNAGGMLSPTDGFQLGTLFRDYPEIRLILLNACEGARNSRQDPFAGVAAALVERGIPAVIGMQFEISDEAAIVFSEGFYTALVDGLPVDAALTEARRSIFFMPNWVEWATPVLFMRSQDGVLFKIQTPSSMELAETQAAQRAEQERLAEEKALAARLVLEKAEAERLAAQKAEAERLARVKAEDERLAAQKAEQERLEKEQAEAERVARERAQVQRLAEQKAEQERLAREKAEAERKAKEEDERLARQLAEQERLAALRVEAEGVAIGQPGQEHEQTGTQADGARKLTEGLPRWAIWAGLLLVGGLIIGYVATRQDNPRDIANSFNNLTTEDASLPIEAPPPTETPPPTSTPPAAPASSGLVVNTPSPSVPTTVPTETAVPLQETTGRIAFVSSRVGRGEIFVMNVDGSEQTSLTDDPAGDWFPAWSPDGTHIAFESRRTGNWDIFVMNADGSEQTRLTDDPADDRIAAWSPDGARIAFSSERDGNSEIYLMNSDGSEQARLTEDPATDRFPAWSPDGARIAFATERDGNWEIYVMDADGSGLTRLTDDPASDRFPEWSPDGTRLAFASERDGNGEVYVMNADGSGLTRLTENNEDDWFPDWSPGGTRIVFESWRDGNGEIYVMNADGSEQTRLTEDPADDFQPAWQPR